MTDLDRLLELYFIQTPNQFSDEYNKLKSKIEQELRKAEKQGDWEVLLGTNQELEQQNKELQQKLEKIEAHKFDGLRDRIFVHEILRGKEE